MGKKKNEENEVVNNTIKTEIFVSLNFYIITMLNDIVCVL